MHSVRDTAVTLGSALRARCAIRSRSNRRAHAPPRVALVTAMLILLFPGLALAHLALTGSTPAEGAHLGAAPREIRLTFSEEVEAAVARVRLLGANGGEVATSAVRQAADSAQVIVADITGALEAGTYSVEWQVIGQDGHPVRGTIPFVIAPGATGLGGVVTAPMADTAAAQHHDPTSMPAGEGFGAESLGYVVVRWLQFTALLIVIGTVAFALVVLGLLRRTEPDGDTVALMQSRAATVGLWASGALLALVFIRLLAQSVAMHSPGQAFSGGLVVSMLTSTVWGWGWILQLLAAALSVAAFYMACRQRAPGWTIAGVACVALAVTPALSGHAASAPRFTGLAIALDTLHVIGAAGWLGSLLLMLAVGIPVAMKRGEGQRGATVARLVNAFSPTALAFAGLVVLTGVFSGWLHIGLSSALWESGYGQTLLIKLAILSVVLATGGYNWLRVKPALGDDRGAHRIRRSASVEVGVGVVVLLVTAVLVATPPPMDMASPMEERTSGGDVATDSTTGMAGMDHSQMGTEANATPAAADSGAETMAGVDHSQMDHSQMQKGGSVAPAAGGARPTESAAESGAMAGMDHSQMPMGTNRPQNAATVRSPVPISAQNAADEKLQRLVAALLRDSVVRTRIQADTALRREWADTSLRRVLTRPPEP